MAQSVVVQGTSPQTVVLGEEVIEFIDVGQQGPPGSAGIGFPVGGTTGQQLAKVDDTDYNTIWVDPPTGSNAYGSLIGDTGTATAVGSESITFTGADTSIKTTVTNGTDTVEFEVDVVDGGYY